MPAAATDRDSAAEADTKGPAASQKMKYAIKTSLSLTLAYLIPMALGWSQPQTAAITVMLIAATGALSESLQKGLMRTLGTVAGAIIGLSLIATFPQDRFAYLVSVSLVITFLLYLYNAYQGDSTIFMLTMVVILMVFNGGDAQGAFIYGVDRTLLTAFGVMIYSLVGSFLWPVKTANMLEILAANVSRAYAEAGRLLSRKDTDCETQERETLEKLTSALDEFRTHYQAVKRDADKVQAYQDEWNTIAGCYEQLESIFVPALRSSQTPSHDLGVHIVNQAEVLVNLDNMLSQLQLTWSGDSPVEHSPPITAIYDRDSMRGEKHLTIAAIASAAEIYNTLQTLLSQLTGAVSSLRFNQGTFEHGEYNSAAPSFIWFDRENIKTALRGFVTFWLATAIWLNYNPPGGFMFVTLCTALVPLVSYTPATPKLLFILFSFGFIFAVPAYVFLLPAMTHWTQLALFLFAYSFIGFFIFAGPVAIFFLLGLFTLGIQNTMSYHFDVIALIILMFYMVCALLIISVHFPFTSKPERLYVDFRRRFYRLSAKIIRAGVPINYFERSLNKARLVGASSLVGKMEMWGSKIDDNYFPNCPASKITAFNHSCESLLVRLKVLTGPNNHFTNNRIIEAAVGENAADLSASLCDVLAREDNTEVIIDTFDKTREKLQNVEEILSEFLDGKGKTNSDVDALYSDHEMAEYYLYINLQASILSTIEKSKESLVGLNWQQLQDTKF
ncbi:MAG: FUSC family protein [Halioglobus sp.]